MSILNRERWNATFFLLNSWSIKFLMFFSDQEVLFNGADRKKASKWACTGCCIRFPFGLDPNQSRLYKILDTVRLYACVQIHLWSPKMDKTSNYCKQCSLISLTVLFRPEVPIHNFDQKYRDILTDESAWDEPALPINAPIMRAVYLSKDLLITFCRSTCYSSGNHSYGHGSGLRRW